jgi:spoIIIJ-associated protein
MSEHEMKDDGESAGDRRRRRRDRAEQAAPAALRVLLPEKEIGPFAKQARDGLRALLVRMGMDVEVGVIAQDDEQVELEVRGGDAQHLVGKKGQVLDALQTIVNRLVKRQSEGTLIVVDAEGYRERRTESLVQLAHRVKEEALSSGKVVALNPMSARDRRIIHMTLRDVDGVSTRSEGEGLDRRLLIVPEP